MTASPIYAAACFDQLNIVMVDQNTPAGAAHERLWDAARGHHGRPP